MEFNRDNIIETAYRGFVFSEKKKSEDVKIYRFENKTGHGEMKVYNILDGIELSYNCLNMETSHQKISSRPGILQIDHCLEGCYEFKQQNSERSFIGKGDLCIVELGKIPFEESRVPTKKYKGLSLFIDIETANRSLTKYFPFAGIDIYKIVDNLCKDGACLVIRSRKEIDHILSELYNVDSRIMKPYSIIKTIELLLFLSLIKREDTKKITSFSEPIYQATKECYMLILNDPFGRYSIKELAKKHAISESSLKRCFSYLTGDSIGNFTRRICLESAAELLVEKLFLPIGDIADIAGYLNQSKFTEAFKKYFGETPQQYRNKFI